MIKLFILNKNDKIEITKEELEQLLNESYYDGFNKNLWAGSPPSSTTSPSTISPLKYGTITVSTADNITKTVLGE